LFGQRCGATARTHWLVFMKGVRGLGVATDNGRRTTDDGQGSL